MSCILTSGKRLVGNIKGTNSDGNHDCNLEKPEPDEI